MIKTACRFLLAAALFSAFSMLWAQQDSSSSSSSQSSPAPDNTKTNQRDRSDAQTADQQSNSASDVEITRQIRKALVADKSLSLYGHNVKIITKQGVVTLKGPVKTEQEKEEIELKAAQVAGGADKVHSVLEVDGGAGEKPSPSSDDHQ
jgi:hyperosmotically inducible periplasmic protein